MSSKRKQRELALQVLFVWDANNDPDSLAQRVTDAPGVDPTDRERALEIARGAWDGRQDSDQWVEKLAPQWPPRRQPGVDRNLIRLGIWELTHADTPPKVVIDEAIELAKEFSTEHSPGFVNGVLDAVHKEIVALKSAGERPEVGDKKPEAGSQKPEARIQNSEAEIQVADNGVQDSKIEQPQLDSHDPVPSFDAAGESNKEAPLDN